MSQLLIALVWCAVAQPTADTVVICPAEFSAALQPWIAYRSDQGHRIETITTSGDCSAADLRARIRQLGDSGELRFVLLVGDVPSADDIRAEMRAATLPTCYVKAKVNVLVGSEPEIASDNPYADLDNDGVPDVAIGRLPVDNALELERLVQRILDYEKSSSFGLWRRQIDVVAGVGGFGPVTDRVLEMATKQFLCEGIPPGYNTAMTYASWRSPYCPDPRIFRQVLLRRWDAGSLFWVYIGHGHTRHLDAVEVPGGHFPIWEAQDAARLNVPRGAPIALWLACYTGAFDQPQDCLAEEMLRSAGGPIAAIANTRVSMPYGMAVLCDAMLEELFQQPTETLGEVLLKAKRHAADEESTSSRRQWLDLLASAFSPTRDRLSEERLEHLALLHLLGDPLLRITRPDKASVEVSPHVFAGEKLEFAGQCSVEGPVLIELACRRDHTRTTAAVPDRFEPTETFLRDMTYRYMTANDPVWCSQIVVCQAGRFCGSLTVPDDARGFCHLRVHASDTQSMAIGAAPVFVRRPSNREEPRVASDPGPETAPRF